MLKEPARSVSEAHVGIGHQREDHHRQYQVTLTGKRPFFRPVRNELVWTKNFWNRSRSVLMRIRLSLCSRLDDRHSQIRDLLQQLLRHASFPQRLS